MIRFDRRRFLSLCLILTLLFSLASCNPSRMQEETVSVPPSYEQYSKQELMTREQSVQEAFDAFTEEIFQDSIRQNTISLHYYLTDPRAFGITDYPITLGEYSSQAIRDSQENNKALLTQLETDFDYDALTESQQLTWDILKAMLETSLACEEYPLYYEYLSPNMGIQAELPILLAEYHFYSRQDVEDYLSVLSILPDTFAKLIAFENEKSQAGLFMCDEGADQVIKGCQDIIADPENHFLMEVFADKINQLEELTEEEKNGYIERNRQLMTDAFFPAYQFLIDGMTALKGSGTNPGGLAGFSNGKKYYEALVKTTTGSSRSVKEMKTLLLNRLNEDLSAINEILKDNESLYSLASDFSFSLTDPEEILTDLKEKIKTDFPVLETETTYTVKTVHPSLEDVMSPALYMVAPIDRLSENTIYINEKQSGDNRTLYATLAHEGYPGHLYQTVFSCSQAPCNLRRVISFPGYSEGWGIYAEYYAYSLDTGADSRLAQIRAHNFSASMAIYALLDIYINYDNWGLEKTSDFLKECYGVENNAASETTYHMIVAEPGYYLKYYVGYLEFCQLRSTAEQRLGDAFSPSEFHRFILETGDCPFWVLSQYMEKWMSKQTAR